jgi:hypothetical protein
MGLTGVMYIEQFHEKTALGEEPMVDAMQEI